MRTRCARLARLARGDSADARSPAGGERAEDECWVEAGVQEAVAAMEAGRRRDLEEEIVRSVFFSGPFRAACVVVALGGGVWLSVRRHIAKLWSVTFFS